MIVADVSFADIFWSILWCYFLFLWIMVLFHILGDLFRDHPVRGDQDPVGAVPGLPTLPGRAGLPAHPGEGNGRASGGPPAPGPRAVRRLRPNRRHHR